MCQNEKARILKELHVPGKPLVLYNIWDAGGALAISKAGAKAIATGSWSVAAAHGFADGETIPLDFALTIIGRISQSTDLPLTVDFEGGYAEDPEQIEKNTARVIKAGAVGINFEDQIVKGSGLYPVADQIDRIKAVRKAADDAGVPLFLNARTDIFLNADIETAHTDLRDEALLRQRAYAQAGADGFFVPGLTDVGLIRDICGQSLLPVNVMKGSKLNTIEELAHTGVSRISFGPGPYFNALEDLTARFKTV